MVRAGLAVVGGVETVAGGFAAGSDTDYTVEDAFALEALRREVQMVGQFHLDVDGSVVDKVSVLAVRVAD